jgi:nucleoside-diphosphate-sugar epimerase
MTAHVLLIGGSGLMGTHAARALLGAGHGVSVLSRGESPLPDGAEPLRADRRDPASLARALAGRRFDLTVDLLAYDAPDVERLFAVPGWVPGRAVLISSGQVYLVTEGGAPPYREADFARPVIPEPPPGTPDHGQWSYGVGKRRAEGAFLARCGAHGVPALVLRLPIVQGAGDGTLRLWAYLERLLDGGPIVLPEGGERPIRHLHAGDLALALVRLAGGLAPPDLEYNLAPARSVTLRVLLERAARAAGVEPRFVPASWEAIEAAGLDPAFSPYAGRWASVLDPSRAEAAWGFRARPVEEFIGEVVIQHLAHRPARSHPGYAQRSIERALATRLGDRR